MSHPFSNALYYPTIDIHNTKWLKTATLFWDSISTIVPESFNNPYNERNTQYLYEIGFLHPLWINSTNESVVDIEGDILTLLSSPEIIQSFFYATDIGSATIHREKMSPELERTINDLQRKPIYAEKMSYNIREKIEESINNHSGDFYYVNPSFSSFYMTALANKICKKNSLAMITDTIPFFTAGNTVKLGNQSCFHRDRIKYRNNLSNRELAQGILLDYIIEGLSLSPETSLDEIIEFKNHHRNELGRFKVELAKLTQIYEDSNKPIETIQYEIKDIYENKFLPAYEDVKKALSGFKIKWFTDSILKISSFSVGTTGISSLLGLPFEKALYAGIGLSIIASSVKYTIDKRQLLRNNPYSYLFSIQNKL